MSARDATFDCSASKISGTTLSTTLPFASLKTRWSFGENTNSRFDRLYIHGREGAIRSEVEYNQEGDVTYRIETKDGMIVRSASNPQNYSLEIEQLGNCILHDEKPLITEEFSLRNAKLIDTVLSEIGYY